MNNIHIALAANHRYLPGLLVTMVSIVRSCSDKQRLIFHVFSDGLSSEDKDKVQELTVKYGAPPPQFLEPDMTPIKAKFGAYKQAHTAFLRLFLCEFLDVDWVLYTDVDTLWLRDICELWELKDDSVMLQWCLDLPSTHECVRTYAKWFDDFNKVKYGCSGVALMNLAKMRRTDFTTQCKNFADKWGTPFFVDQDILNYVCRNDSALLPGVWDCLIPTREAVNGLVYHFTGIGSMFNSSFAGWRPLYYPWFRFYYDFVLEQQQRPACSLFKRLIFWLLGSFYPNRKLIAFLLRRAHYHWTDNIERQLFFAWLWRHAKWLW